ncbi:hypothetical protein FNJ84_15340 [Paracoccus sp. M683]|uniref:hypothetical protein n=1 Tax=Paracoccus sp. M683 TaxID=2594268 RepID=UPI0011814CEC|nr:hypothetical protein [Paracoccus sp. M683]TRW95753.1 hypothetical protein FNJ84_15340 [Paracoccus sp. M683]
MLTKQFKLAAILTAAMGTSALAQEATVVETPGGQTAILPADAVESTGVSPDATAAESEYPIFNQDMNDQTIADTLLSQGFGDIYILREGSLMTVTATRDGDDIKLVYNLVEGRLIEVNGERVLTEEERTLTESGSTDTATAGETEDTEGTDDGATDDGSTDDGSADDGASDDGGTDDSGTDDSGTDDSGADDGAGDDSGNDSDSGGEGGSDSDGTNG